MGGAVIGRLPGAQYRRGFMRVEPGNLLVLLTDGIIGRRRSTGELFGAGRLKGLVETSRSASASELLQRILDTAHAFGDSQPWEDDVTLMVIRRCEV